MPNPQYEVVLTRTGKRLHYAVTGEWHTLCFRAVAHRRIGGSWVPEQNKDYNDWPTCMRCNNHVTGEIPA